MLQALNPYLADRILRVGGRLKNATLSNNQKYPITFAKVSSSKSSPYQSIGTDLMGPLMIRSGRNSLKIYVCIFNCLATRAVHFEIVQSLEASAFIQAYRRFCNRRNVKPTDVYSDNGRNFGAADKEIRKGVKNWQSKQVSDALLQK